MTAFAAALDRPASRITDAANSGAPPPLSLGDIATSDDIDQAAEALSGISRPTAPPAVMNI